jgi:hypothetical protein
MLIPIMERLEDMATRRGYQALTRACFEVIPVMAQLDLLGYDLLFEH